MSVREEQLADVCSLPGCGKPATVQKLCNAHYKRKRRHGDPLKGRTGVGIISRYIEDVVVPFAGSECLTWPFMTSGTGYPLARYAGKLGGTHRIVCELVHGKPPTPKHEAAHSCGKGHLGCVNPNHLQWKTSKENKADKLIHGTQVRGSMAPGAVLIEEQVREIRALRGVVAGKELARRFGVSAATISAIQHRTSWSWL